MIEIIPIDIYINTVIIASGIDEREFDLFYYDNVLRMTNEEYERIREDIVNPNSCAGVTTRLECGSVFVFIRKGKEREDLTVIHELYHATNNVLMRAGVNHDEDDEPYAYLLAWLTNEYYNRLDEYETKNKL